MRVVVIFSSIKFIKKDMKFEKFLKNNLNLILILPLFLYKSKKFLLEPRIWAEEGTVYLKSALNNDFLSIFKIQQGYFSLIPNVTIYFASLGNYKYIPYYTSIVSLFFWFLLFALINNINSKKLKENYTFKFFLGISIFTILNSYQEIFLNTINLQFITPLITGILLLYDFSKLSKIQLAFAYVILSICLLNGVLSFVLLPLLLWKLYSSKKTFAFVYFILIAIIPVCLIIFSKSNADDVSISQRLIKNIQFKIKVFTGYNLKFLIQNNWYFSILLISGYAFYRKNFAVLYYSLAAILLFLFIDYTKITVSIISRYLTILYSFLCLTFFLLFQKNKWVLGVTSILIIAVFGKSFFDTDISYSDKINKWSDEYKKLYQGKTAEIQPETFLITIDKSE